MKDIGRLSAAEQDVMHLLWEAKAPVRPSALLVSLAPTHPWSISTLQTMLERLRAKGVAALRFEGRFRTYFPAVTREEYALAEVTRLLKETSGGRAFPLVRALIEENEFTDRERAALTALLTKKEG